MHGIFSGKVSKDRTYNVFIDSLNDPEINRISKDLESKNKGPVLVKGHLPFGLHKYLNGEARYLTFLRDPVKRVISQYFYIKLNKNNQFHELLHKENLSISQFLENGHSPGLNNGQLRWMLGEVRSIPYNQVDDSHLSEAIDNLESFYDFVGISEKFDESLQVLSRYMQWKKAPLYRRRNLNKSRNTDQVTDEDLAAIRHYNKHDIKLYEVALQRLNNEISGINNFKECVEKYKKMNRWYQTLFYPLNLINR